MPAMLPAMLLALPRLVPTFSLSSDTDTPQSASPEPSPRTPRYRPPRPTRKKQPPPPIRIPDNEEINAVYGSIAQSLSDRTKEEVAACLANPVAVIFRENIDPGAAIDAFASLEDKYFHADRDDDRLFQVLIDRLSAASPIVTIYIIPERYIPQLCEELLLQELALIRGAPIIMRGKHIDTYDPSGLIRRDLGLDIHRRIYMVDNLLPKKNKQQFSRHPRRDAKQSAA